jgi:hypothetical protein
MIKKSPTYGGYGGGDTSKFRELAEAWAKRPQGDPRRALIERAEREARERQASDYQEAYRAVSDAVKPTIDAEALAAKILAAGRKARGRMTEQDKAEEASKLSPAAKFILDCGKRRRGEIE